MSSPYAANGAAAGAVGQRILVVGGGAAGLVTLRNLLDVKTPSGQPAFDVTLVERRDDVGGVWYWSDETYQLERSLSPDRTQSVWPLKDQSGRPHWPSPAYLNLKGNVLPEYLQFAGHPFPPPSHGDTFPTLKETHDYLRSFAKPLESHIRLGIEVLRVEELLQGGWEVEWKDWNRSADRQADRASSSSAPLQQTSGPSQETTVQRFDRVVVACGWYDTPLYPKAEGMAEARRAGFVHHAKHYRDSATYRGKKVVVVGNNNSSNEAAAHLAVHNTREQPVYKSAKRPPVVKCPCLPDERIRDVGVIARYELVPQETGSPRLRVHIEDGTVIEDVDYVLLGTGYGHSFPFVRVLTDEARTAQRQQTQKLTPPELQGVRVPNLFRHILFAKSADLSLAFVGVVVSFFPFNMADLSSRWLSLVWSGRIRSAVPASVEERLKDEQDRLEYIWTDKERHLAARNGGRPAATLDRSDPMNAFGFHTLGGSLKEGGPSELVYGAQLRREIVEADPSMADWYDDWGEERERKQYEMYDIKRRWLLDNEERIKSDPFDLLGRNSAYRHLADEMVAQQSGAEQVVDDRTTAAAPPAPVAPMPSMRKVAV
ncbi:uncharacterized protein PFL1_05804 [Pseudozyma flocculosa PF-1]|uniref:Related to FMO1 - flavin-containing monooxygenase n=2 Tax=Pseudozyma flocculosa TaxID=84751 RepID=A0A5C3F2J9_9BASI|nr:uncharacterized protein PFL1_05804 [Pseudozyma flocculosa PF-1]EPQ26482.1 hypothetical protein PFL1_05804 [Pseudozyma flocculosa PF-1]SPO38532.1 related to FMO1 - flavin-containing monooxygenase [Pseudozyma flocculosa]